LHLIGFLKSILCKRTVMRRMVIAVKLYCLISGGWEQNQAFINWEEGLKLESPQSLGEIIRAGGEDIFIWQ
jgi:hypothetical protein